MTTRHLIAAATCVLATGLALSAQADVLASTDFDDSTASGNIKSNLNWTLNGLEDPGDMAALNAGGGNQTLFNDNSFVQDIFIPGLNTGNGNTFWTTEVDLTVAAGFDVTLTDVTFNYVAVNGGQALNVPRNADFKLTLLTPSGSEVQSLTIEQVRSGTTEDPQTPLVTVDFDDVALTEPGTYTLQIAGGDIVNDETGNHTGIDNLSINGTAVPEPSAIALLGLGGLLVARRRRR